MAIDSTGTTLYVAAFGSSRVGVFDVASLEDDSFGFSNAGYGFVFRGVRDADGPNYDASRATIELFRGERAIATLTPEKRLYLAQGMPMTEASIDIGPFRDVYVSLGERLEDDSWLVSLYYKPFISWIWLGCTMMALGGVFAAADRRYRRTAERAAPAAARQPA